VRLTWPTAGVTYQVRRSSTGTSGPFQVIAQTSAALFDDLNLNPTLSYTYELWLGWRRERGSHRHSAGARTGSRHRDPELWGAATSADGTATVALAPGSVAGTVAVSILPSGSSPLGFRALSAVFDLNAVDTATGAAIDSLATAPC